MPWGVFYQRINSIARRKNSTAQNNNVLKYENDKVDKIHIKFVVVVGGWLLSAPLQKYEIYFIKTSDFDFINNKINYDEEAEFKQMIELHEKYRKNNC